jgi:hypothetical protein
MAVEMILNSSHSVPRESGLSFALCRSESKSALPCNHTRSDYYFRLKRGPHCPRAWEVCFLLMYIPKVTHDSCF